jgi:hypothetical protein
LLGPQTPENDFSGTQFRQRGGRLLAHLVTSCARLTSSATARLFRSLEEKTY